MPCWGSKKQLTLLSNSTLRCIPKRNEYMYLYKNF